MNSFQLLSTSALALSFVCAGCASQPPRPNPEMETLRSEMSQLRTALSETQARLDATDAKVLILNDRVQTIHVQQEVKTPVITHPADRAGTEPKTVAAAQDPGKGFQSDEAIQGFRKALALRQSGKLSESLLAFSNFVERYPDHPLAGNAQYLVGDAYYQQKEYKLAVRELTRILTSYDRSPRVPDALKEIVESYEALQQPEQAAKHHQWLSSLYPQSPAALQKPTVVPAVPTAGTPPL